MQRDLVASFLQAVHRNAPHHIRRVLRPGTHIAVGMSGGVDSSLSAWLLKQAGFRVTGVFMKNWDELDENGVCTGERDALDAERMAQAVGIPFHRVSFVKEYWNEVFVRLLVGYQRGITPNPDVLCNSAIKFDAFLAHCKAHVGANIIATGHYAQLGELPCGEVVQLLAGADAAKDQTYFLSRLPQHALRECVFPVGHMLKSEVKEAARSLGFACADRKESMGICFVGKRRSFADFLKQYIDGTPGDFVCVDTGRRVGGHVGTPFYTIGQRARISGVSHGYYVCGRDMRRNIVFVAPARHHPALLASSCIAAPISWNALTPNIEAGFACGARFVHRGAIEAATLTPTGTHTPMADAVNPICGVSAEDITAGECVRVDLAQPVWGITPGQVMAVYQGNVCMGSAELLASGRPALGTGGQTAGG